MLVIGVGNAYRSDEGVLVVQPGRQHPLKPDTVLLPDVARGQWEVGTC